MKPTDEQIKEFWKGYGVKPEKRRGYFNYDIAFVYPPIDLNNLFRSARAKAKIDSVHFSWGDGGVLCWVYTKRIIGKPFFGKADTEEDALFWALDKVRRHDG